MTDRHHNHDDPLAYLITWTCYGTWLPGDDRGSWHRCKWHEANELFREMATAELTEAPFWLSLEDRAVVEQTIAKHCDVRGWTLHAVKARSNHVHVVVTARGYEPETVRNQFKTWCTRKLKPNYPGCSRFWTAEGQLPLD